MIENPVKLTQVHKYIRPQQDLRPGIGISGKWLFRMIVNLGFEISKSQIQKFIILESFVLKIVRS